MTIEAIASRMRRPSGPPFLGEAAGLGVGEPDLGLSEVRSEDSVLLDDVFNDALLVTVQPAGGGGGEERESRRRAAHPERYQSLRSWIMFLRHQIELA